MAHLKPYYERGGITIYLGDCRDVLPTMPKACADIIVTDPPYGIGYEGQSSMRVSQGRYGVMAGDDDSSWIAPLLDSSLPVLKTKRHLYVFGPATLMPERAPCLTEIIWDKQIQGMGGTAPWANQHERISFGVWWPSLADRRAGRGNGAARLRQGTVLKYRRPNGRGVNRHPTEKPVDLLCRLVESSSLLGETVLDPFVGSGSTLVAAIVERRNGVGIEVEEKYAETAAKRCESALNWMASAGSF